MTVICIRVLEYTCAAELQYEDPLKDVHGPFDAAQIINWFAQVGHDMSARIVYFRVAQMV